MKIINEGKGRPLLFRMEVKTQLTIQTFRALSRPDAFEAVSLICRTLIQAGAMPCFVGGCVRDAILGLKISDFDIEVFGMSLDAVERLIGEKFSVEQTGKAFCVLKLHGLPIDISVPRVEIKSGKGHGDFLTSAREKCDVRTAASRRDFTINAIYFDLSKGKIVDEFGGIGDLSRGVLAHVGRKFSEDPLRVLRGMQFAGRFNLKAKQSTLSMCRKLSIDDLSKERIFGEWEKLILKATKPSLGLRFLKDSGWLKFFPEIASIDACMQDKRKHPEGSVFEHACQALDVFAQTRIGDWREDLIVGFATLCHDFGKPHAISEDEFGIHHYNHDKAGVAPTENFLKSIGTPNYLIAAIVPLVRWHIEPRLVYDEDRSDRGILLLANKVGRIDRLLRLCRADFLGRTDPVKNYAEKMERWIKSSAQRLGVLSNRPPPIVQGRDLLALGMVPSENFAKILQSCFMAQLNCEFSDHDSAVEFLRKIAQSGD